MIGPQAWENMGVNPHRTGEVVIEHEGKRYIYHTWSDDWILFDNHEQFKLWVLNDVQNNNGNDADEVVA